MAGEDAFPTSTSQQIRIRPIAYPQAWGILWTEDEHGAVPLSRSLASGHRLEKPNVAVPWVTQQPRCQSRRETRVRGGGAAAPSSVTPTLQFGAPTSAPHRPLWGEAAGLCGAMPRKPQRPILTSASPGEPCRRAPHAVCRQPADTRRPVASCTAGTRLLLFPLWRQELRVAGNAVVLPHPGRGSGLLLFSFPASNHVLVRVCRGTERGGPAEDPQWPQAPQHPPARAGQGRVALGTRALLLASEGTAATHSSSAGAPGRAPGLRWAGSEG